MKRDENGLYVANDGSKHGTDYHALKHDEEDYRAALNHGLKPADLNGKLAQIVTLLFFFFAGWFFWDNKSYFLSLLMIPIGLTVMMLVDWCVKRIHPFLRLLILLGCVWFALYAGNGGWWR